jgi:nicotinamidase-related amidase
MPAKIRPAKSRQALLIVDVINDLDFPGGENVLPWAKRMVKPLSAARQAAHQRDIPVIYANDNYGHWHSDFKEVYRHCVRRGARGREVATRLRPTAKDYFVLKPRHSAFFATSLKPLLEYLKVEKLILAGIATNLCVLFTAHDAHMYGFEMIVLSDCCAAESDEDHNLALDQLQRFCGAKICLSEEWRAAMRSRTTSKKPKRQK